MHFQHGLIDLNAVGPVAVLVLFKTVRRKPVPSGSEISGGSPLKSK